MAEKILQTRIINKHALLTEWESSNLQLKEGEIALAKVMVAQKDGTEAPTYVAKVGIEGKTFSECPMFYAPASDVYGWAKASTKPAYAADEIARGTSTVKADLASAEERLDTLEAAVGSNGTVATQIDTKITAALDLLDLSEVTVGTGKIISTIKQENGKVTVTTRDLAKEDIPTIEIAQVNGLKDALDAKAVETSVAERFSAVDTKIGTSTDAAGASTVYGAIATAKKAGDDAQAAIDAYIESNDAALALVKETAEAARTESEVDGQIDAKIATFKTNVTDKIDERVVANNTAIANEVTRATGVEGGLDTRLKAAEEAISTLNAATTLEGVGALADRPAAGKVAGGIWIATDNNKEYVWDGNAWIELGDTTAEMNAINGLDERIDAIEADLGTSGDTAKAIAAAQKAADDAQDAADTANAAIEVINGTGAGSISKAVADATSALQTYADGKASAAQSAAEATAKGYTDAEVKKVSDALGELSTTVGNNATTAANATKKVADDLAAYQTANDAALAGVKTTAEKGVTDAAAALQYAKDLEAGQVKTNKENIAALDTDVTYIENNYARVSGNKLVYGQGESEMTIIFDCGGAQ